MRLRNRKSSEYMIGFTLVLSEHIRVYTRKQRAVQIETRRKNIRCKRIFLAISPIYGTIFIGGLFQERQGGGIKRGSLFWT